MKRIMLTSALIFMLGGVASAISWIDGETPTGAWRITTSPPHVAEEIYFSGPLSRSFQNSCIAQMEHNAGGSPALITDNANKTIELWFEPPAPTVCPTLDEPVCGLEGSLGSLEAGKWIFFGNNPVASFSISFDVLMSDLLCGDVTGNGDVSSTDASLVAQYAAGMIDWFTEEQIWAADVNCDGSVTSEDAQLILDYVAGSIDELQCCNGGCSDPYVIALPATDITSTSATLWGKITDDGGCQCEYQFGYRLDEVGAEYVYTNWTGSVTTGELFSQTISSLKPDSKYYFSVQVKNDDCQSSWALSKNFTTTDGSKWTFSDDFNDGVIDPNWEVGNRRWIEESSGEIRFHGTTEHSGWGVGGWGVSVDSFSEGDFDVSVDFRIPRFDGLGTRLIYLQAHSWDEITDWEQTVGIFYSYGSGYRLQSWNPGQFSSWLYPFGNEITNFHKMRLTYDSKTQSVSGYVDDILVGSLSAKMGGDLTFTIGPATETQGMIIDARYDNFNAEVGNSSPGTNGLVAHYAFEKDTTDSSDNGLDGTIIGDVAFVNGVEGMALDLSGANYVYCGGAAEFSFSEAMTISTWVNIRSHTTAWMAIVAKGENAWRLSVNNETMGIHYAFSGSDRGWLGANTATELAFGEWYHVAATYDTSMGARLC
jgi:hypothetical protein